MQRFPFAASAEYGPSGRYSSKLETGTSGMFVNVELVIPALEMNVSPTRFTRTPYPWSTATRFGNASPPCETKYTGPDSLTGRIGVTACTAPITDAAGHDAGFASNVASGHAFCSVVNREGSCLGSSTLTCAMFDCGPEGNASFASRLAPSAFEVLPDVATLNFGPNDSPAHPATANGVDTSLCVPCEPGDDAVMFCCAQFVGLKMNPGRLIVTFVFRSRRGIPSRICGSGSVVTVNAVVYGSTLIIARTTTFPRLNGPAWVGTTIDRPNGAPLYGPVRYTCPFW